MLSQWAVRWRINISREKSINRDGRTSLPRRLLGWLFHPFRRRHSIEPPPEPAEPELFPPEPESPAVDAAPLVWPPERVNIVEKLWGDGYITAGGAKYVLGFMPLLALSEKKSLLLLGAGLGGIARTMVDETGVWISGYESDGELAALGMEKSVMAGKQKRAPVKLADYTSLQLKSKYFDAAVSLENFYQVENKEDLFAAVAESLRVDGDLIFTDFVLVPSDAPDPAVRDWIKSEPYTPHPWTADKIQSCLSGLNLNVRPYEDITRQYRSQLFMGLLKFLAGTTKGELLEIVDDLFEECKYLGKRIAAIDSGGLKVHQFHAIKLPDKRGGL